MATAGRLGGRGVVGAGGIRAARGAAGVNVGLDCERVADDRRRKRVDVRLDRERLQENGKQRGGKRAETAGTLSRTL